MLASITELSFNAFGFCAALFGCLATSTKTILAESLLHGYKFDRYSFPSLPLSGHFKIVVDHHGSTCLCSSCLAILVMNFICKTDKRGRDFKQHEERE